MPAKFSRALRAGVVLVAAVCALGPATGQAFTLIQPTTKLFLVPKSGYPTTYIQVRGTLQFGSNPCAAGVPPAPLAFNFYFDAAAIWSKTVVCVNSPTVGIWNTGNSPFIKPPNPSVGNHVVYLKVINPANGVQTGAAQSAYTIFNPPASPVPSPSPSPPPTPSSTGCAVGAATTACPTSSPSNAACPAAMLPPSGTGSWGDNLVAGLVVAAVLPLAGLTIFGPGTLLAFARRRRRLLLLIGLSALTALTLSCTTVAKTPIPAPLISPPASPSSSCSA